MKQYTYTHILYIYTTGDDLWKLYSYTWSWCSTNVTVGSVHYTQKTHTTTRNIKECPGDRRGYSSFKRAATMAAAVLVELGTTAPLNISSKSTPAVPTPLPDCWLAALQHTRSGSGSEKNRIAHSKNNYYTIITESIFAIFAPVLHVIACAF